MGLAIALVQAMADSRNSDDSPPDPLRRIAGPLDGYRLGATDIPVRILDLGLDGCLVELSFLVPGGKHTRLQIDLPGEGWTVVQCETLHAAGINTFAVKFVRMDDATHGRLLRAVDRLSTDQAPPDRKAADD